jgi:ribosome-associated inhibitor A
MELRYQGIDFEITPAIEEHIKEKFNKLPQFNGQLISATVRLKKNNADAKSYILDVNVASKLGDLHQSVTHTDVYRGLNELADKIIRQIRKQSEKNQH